MNGISTVQLHFSGAAWTLVSLSPVLLSRWEKGKGFSCPCIYPLKTNFLIGLTPSKNSPEIIFFLSAPLPQFLYLSSAAEYETSSTLEQKYYFVPLSYFEKWNENFCFTGKSIPSPTTLHITTDNRKIPVLSKLDRCHHKVRRNHFLLSVQSIFFFSFNMLCTQKHFIHQFRSSFPAAALHPSFRSPKPTVTVQHN